MRAPWCRSLVRRVPQPKSSMVLACDVHRLRVSRQLRRLPEWMHRLAMRLVLPLAHLRADEPGRSRARPGCASGGEEDAAQCRSSEPYRVVVDAHVDIVDHADLGPEGRSAFLDRPALLEDALVEDRTFGRPRPDGDPARSAGRSDAERTRPPRSARTRVIPVGSARITMGRRGRPRDDRRRSTGRRMPLVVPQRKGPRDNPG